MKVANWLSRLLTASAALLLFAPGCTGPQTLTQTATPGTLSVNETSLPTPAKCLPQPTVNSDATAESTSTPPSYTCGPAFLVTGPDRNLWITNPGGDTIYSFNPSQQKSATYTTQNGHGPAYITVGPDGGVWFGEVGSVAALLSLISAGTIDALPPPPPSSTNYVGELVPNLTDSTKPATLNELQVPEVITDFPLGLALGYDGNLWADYGGVAPFAAGGVLPVLTLDPLQMTNVPRNEVPLGIVGAPDGSIWLAEPVANKIARIDLTTRSITEFPATAGSIPVGPTALAIGADGALWYIESLAGKIGHMVIVGSQSQPTGTILGEYPTPTSPSNPADLVLGPDCNIWFTEMATGLVGSVDTNGKVSEYSGLDPASQPLGIALGPDGMLWIAESAANKLAQISPAAGFSNNKCSVLVLPAIAKCNNSAPLLTTDPGKCSTTLTTGEFDAGSSDPNNPGKAPVESVKPSQIQRVTGGPIVFPTEVELLVSPSAAPSNSAPLPLPVSACEVTTFVVDEEPPKLTCAPPIQVKCSGRTGTPANVTTTATDNCGTVSQPVCLPAGPYQPGVTPVVCKATDASKNVGSCNTSVTVTEAPPTITLLSANPSEFKSGPGNVTVNITASAQDTCDTVPPRCTVTGVSGGPASITGPLQVSIADQGNLLSARVYTISVTCAGQANNNATGTTRVRVDSPLDELFDSI